MSTSEPDVSLVTVTVKATNVATDTTNVVAKIAKVASGVTTTDLQASYTVSLYKVTGGEWQASLELTRDTEYSLHLFVNDAAAGSPVTFTPSAAAKTVSVSGGATRTNTNPVAVNDGTPTNPKVVFVDKAETFDVLANDTNADGDSLVIVSITAPQQNGAVNGTVTIAADGKSLTYKGPAATTSQLTTFNYTDSDGHGGAATATVYVFVQSGGSF